MKSNPTPGHISLFKNFISPGSKLGTGNRKMKTKLPSAPHAAKRVREGERRRGRGVVWGGKVERGK